jgi:nucleotide-binding universal stress UspA family protein
MLMDQATGTPRLVLAVDDGPCSATAVEWVIDRAADVDFDIEVTTVIPLGETTQLAAGWRPRVGSERAVAVARARLRDALPQVRTVGMVCRGEPLVELAAASRHASLLVIGSDSEGEWSGPSGTLPLLLAEYGSCPVIVVPVGWTVSDGPVVVGADGDVNGQAALLFAAEEAERRHSMLEIVHSWSIPETAGLEYGVSLPMPELVAAHQALLTQSVAVVEPAHPQLHPTRTLMQGPPAAALVRAAAAARLVVVGTHHRGGTAGLIIGSVGAELLLSLPCPVAVVPPVDPTGRQASPV